MGLLQKQREILARAIAGRSVDIPLLEGIGTRLTVYETDYPGGPPNDPTKVMRKDNDLLLDNFGLLLAAFIAPYTGSAGIISGCTIKDTAGATHPVYVWYSSTSSIINRDYRASGWLVGVGNNVSPTAPARTDYNLQTQVGSWSPISAPGIWTSAAGTVTFTGSVLLAGGATVTEAGVEAILERGDGTATATYLMFHDTFTGVPVAAGKYAHAAFTWQL